MRQKLIGSIISSRAVSYGLQVILIFIVATKQPVAGIEMDQKKSSYLALGDSYTIGEQVLPADNFPNQVVSQLKDLGFNYSTPDIIAKTGWTTDELQVAIDEAAPGENYDLVTLLIGVNNQYRGRPVEEYAKEFESLLQQAIRFAGNHKERVIVLSIPDWGVTPFAGGRDRQQIAKEIDTYNAANLQLVMKYQVPYIDVTGWTRESSGDSSLLAADGLHPSGKEYKRWAEKIVARVASRN